MVVVIFWSSCHCYEIKFLDRNPAQEATTTNKWNQSGEIRWRGARLTSEQVKKWPVFLMHVGKGNWKGNPVGTMFAMFVVRMLQRALMQIVLEVPDGPRKRKQNEIGTPKKSHEIADGQLILRQVDQVTLHLHHSSAGRQRYQRMWRRCRQDLLILGWTFFHVGWLMKRVFWYLGLGKMMVRRALAVLMLDLGLNRHIGYYMVLLWISTFV